MSSPKKFKRRVVSPVADTVVKAQSIQKEKKKDYAKMALAMHKAKRGKLEVISKGKLETRDDWSTMYTPGVGAVSSHLAKNPKDASVYTMKGNTVAVISDGSAVLGLGNIGPVASLPVMEGKAAIFKEMAGIDSFPIVLDVHEVDEIVDVVKAIAPGFGGINLEDIGAPKCFEIEERLKKELAIPVMHDDQHGTAIVVLAGLINASKVVRKKLESLRVVIVGAGAAGHAIAMLLVKAGIRDVIVTDSKGIISTKRTDMAPYKVALAKKTNPRKVHGVLADAIDGADVVVGVSGPGAITKEHVSTMADKAIVFALANPIPEIAIEEARAAGAFVIATGRSDFPNQVNNALVFPGVFRGALKNGVTKITDDMKIKAAQKVASLVKKPTPEMIIPHVTTPNLVKTVASAIK